ncbi:Transmembrane amino acid transporter protein [Blastocystis sp. ATCC 50177/Nand II]|uniref:Transmembrane amino acid transporter protein n=1 Tax=Blastocystis sp. subtype 1 (strain ATCC 50177 / NandII) TaxID=478820 RepID=A0A196S7Q9_BLAHN|nr:Transmembrane amino acid transporter protein [Blastocystis sp. ATCC 50177/Nand II]
MDATTSQELQQTLIDPQKQQSAEKTAVEVVPDSAALLEDDASKSTSLQFSANLMKSITGSTSLIFPYTMWQMGLITGTTLTVFVVYVYISFACRMLDVRKAFEKEEKDENDPLYHLDNDYTILCYHYFGKAGYWLVLICTLITLWGSDMGTMILMTDFLSDLPPFNRIGSASTRRILPTIILLFFCWITSILKNPTLLVSVSSLGLFALVIAFIVCLIDGGVRFGISWDKSVLFPQSLMGILSTLGIIINAFGFMLNNMKSQAKPKVKKNITGSLSLLGLIYLVTGIVLFLMYRSDPRHVQEAVIFNMKKDSLPFILVSITMVLTLLGSFPLLLLPCFEIMEANHEKKENRLFVTDGYRFWTRTAQVVIITLIGYFIPVFSSINAIIGSLTGVIVSQLVPAFLHLKAIGSKKGMWLVIEDWIVIVVFIGVMIICTGSSVVDLINKLKH